MITYFNAGTNPLLNCITVDNEDAANAGEWPYEDWYKDSQVTYSEDCPSNIDRTYIPDPNFEQHFINMGADGVLDGQILTAVAQSFSNLFVSGINISDLTGIEDFVNLTELQCSDNNLTSLNVSTLTALEILNFS